jgi:corrinoid protein of di/trimethylamine methyltransferase
MAGNKDELLGKMQQSVLDGDEDAAAQLANDALEAGIEPLTAIEKGYVPGLRKAGDLWEEGEYFLPELVTAAQAMKAAMAVIQPRLGADASSQEVGRVVIGTVQGDIHDIGKTLVGTLLSANGFSVSDEGGDVPVSRFVERAKEIDADLVCASALLTTTMTVQQELVTALKEAGLRAQVMVGGAPVSAEWAKQIGAAGFADNAVAAVEVAQKLVGRG